MDHFGGRKGRFVIVGSYNWGLRGGGNVAGVALVTGFRKEDPLTQQEDHSGPNSTYHAKACKVSSLPSSTLPLYTCRDFSGPNPSFACELHAQMQEGVRSHSRYAPREDERVALDTSSFLRESHYGLPIQTVTVNVGQTARLTCFVQTPGDYKVAWMKTVINIVLSMGEAVIIRDPRMSVQREQRSTWFLTITNVTIKDHGYYTCNINTLPPTSIHGFLNVVEPPVLDDKDEELWVMEGMKAVLSCSAHGTPTPSYKWFREDYSRIRLNSSTYVQSWEKRKLILEHVNHQTAGGYICIASNGYPPSKSKRVVLNVYFAPKVRGPGSQIWAQLGQTVSLTCLYAAFPAPNVMWILENHLGLRRFTEEYFTNTIQDGHPPYT
ncbi:lachesin-like [Macrobrachium rosenbergii]|uniref:lachesin-like n=1 Tax=Macrobrachium rosenbergii TaxID=79674 RepID=UPI0034D3EEAB